MGRYEADKGYFHIAFEFSAVAPAIRPAISALRPCGTLIQIGVAGDMPIPFNALVSSEIRMQGTHGFDTEFAEAVDAIALGRIDVRHIITSTYPLEDAAKSVKVHLSFNGMS